jgi:IS4 transposase
LELFFKWIKQHLRIKAFLGNSENAVKTQVWIALSVYVLVAILKKKAAVERVRRGDGSLRKLLRQTSMRDGPMRRDRNRKGAVMGARLHGTGASLD